LLGNPTVRLPEEHIVQSGGGCSPEQIMTAIVSAPDTFYIFRWDRHGRKGKRCLVLARGTMNSCLVKFEDGFTMVTSRNALKRYVTGRVTPRSQ